MVVVVGATAPAEEDMEAGVDMGVEEGTEEVEEDGAVVAEAEPTA